jgi:hypothetical protein
LKSDTPKRPTIVASPAAPASSPAGFVYPSFDEGTLFLKNAKGEWFRLEWAKTPAGTANAKEAQRRPLPPGDYTLASYRIIRRDAKGKEWFLSVTGANLQRISLRSGEEKQVRLDDKIKLMVNAKGKEELVVTLGVLSADGIGMTVYHEGKRLDIAYVVKDAQGQKLASGTFDYG